MHAKTILALAATALLTCLPALAENPYMKPDDSWISISGTVVDPTADSFLLDYGTGVITVEVDDWDPYSETYGLLDGDRVIVYGRVDDDLFENASIEAGAIYIKGLNAYIYASSVDEESNPEGLYPYYWSVVDVPVANQVTIRGTVTGVDSAEGTFKVDRGKRAMTVDTETMAYNPLDKHGYQKIEVGDVVSVTGLIDYNFMGKRVLDAEAVTTILDSSRS